MHNFKELKVWLEAKNLSVFIYKTTKVFPNSELYGITSQMNRASVSIASNIAEGAGRNSNKDFARFISIAIGSAFELETQLIVALEIELIDKLIFEEANSRVIKVQKMLSNFNKHLYS